MTKDTKNYIAILVSLFVIALRVVRLAAGGGA